jgi:hypothetical protein
VDQPSGTNSVSPDVELTLGTNSASPELGLGYLLPLPPPPRIPRKATLLTVAHVIETQDGLGLDLGQTSASPEPGSALDILMENAPNVIR